MRKVLFISILLCFASGYVSAQEAPFRVFDEAVKKESGGLSGNKENLSTIFNAERIRLGNEFETALWKYLGDDADKHFWISSFLTAKSYLHGNEPLPELAFKIRTRALELLQKKNDKRSLGRKVTINRKLAVSSKLAGKQDDAERFRDSAETILAKHDDLSAYISGRTEYEICIYQNIAGSINKCDPDPPPKERIVSGGVLNGKAIKLPQVRNYPDEAKKAKAAGLVRIKVLIDFDGNVIEAEPVGGRPELFEVTLEAARLAKFSPTTLSGKPVKVSGVLVYNFVL